MGASRVLLENEYKHPGTHTTSFDTSGLPAGLYLYRLIAGGEVFQRKMLVVQ